jgi:hypothetical protein
VPGFAGVQDGDPFGVAVDLDEGGTQCVTLGGGCQAAFPVRT